MFRIQAIFKYMQVVSPMARPHVVRRAFELSPDPLLDAHFFPFDLSFRAHPGLLACLLCRGLNDFTLFECGLHGSFDRHRHLFLCLPLHLSLHEGGCGVRGRGRRAR